MRIKFIPAIFVFPFFLTFALPELNAQDEGSDIFDKLKKQNIIKVIKRGLPCLYKE